LERGVFSRMFLPCSRLYLPRCSPDCAFFNRERLSHLPLTLFSSNRCSHVSINWLSGCQDWFGVEILKEKKEKKRDGQVTTRDNVIHSSGTTEIYSTATDIVQRPNLDAVTQISHLHKAHRFMTRQCLGACHLMALTSQLSHQRLTLNMAARPSSLPFLPSGSPRMTA